MQRTHHFSPTRPPSPTFRNHTEPIVDYIAALLPPPPIKRMRSISPSPSIHRANTYHPHPIDSTRSTPVRSWTAPLPQRFELSRPLPPRRNIPFPTLAATANGEVYDDISSPILVGDSPAVSASPSFPSLQRTPSSAFLHASQAGRVNPLTLQALARSGSETEALKVVREREERDRRWREENAQAAGGANGRIGVSHLHRPSWSATGSMMGRSESSTGLRKEREGSSGTERGERMQGSNGTVVPGTTDAGYGSQREEEQVESFGLARTPSLKGKSRELLSVLEHPSSLGRLPSTSPTLPGDGTRTKKRSFFSKLGGRPRTPSGVSKAEPETLSARSATGGTLETSAGLPEVVVEKTRVDKGKGKEKIRYVKVSVSTSAAVCTADASTFAGQGEEQVDKGFRQALPRAGTLHPGANSQRHHRPALDSHRLGVYSLWTLGTGAGRRFAELARRRGSSDPADGTQEERRVEHQVF